MKIKTKLLDLLGKVLAFRVEALRKEQTSAYVGYYVL